MRFPSSLHPYDTSWDGRESGGGCTVSSLETDWLIISVQPSLHGNLTSLSHKGHTLVNEGNKNQEVVNEMCASERQLIVKGSFLVRSDPHVFKYWLRTYACSAFSPTIKSIWAKDLQLKSLQQTSPYTEALS